LGPSKNPKSSDQFGEFMNLFHFIHRLIKVDPTIKFELNNKVHPEIVEARFDKMNRKVSFLAANRNPGKYETFLNGDLLKIEVRRNLQSSFTPIAFMYFDADKKVVSVTIRLHRVVQFMNRVFLYVSLVLIAMYLFDSSESRESWFLVTPLGLFIFSIAGILFDFIPKANEIKQDICQSLNKTISDKRV
jgi:hypothetical protein